MDSFYNKSKAAALVDELASERKSQYPEGFYLSELNLGAQWQRRLDFIQRLDPAEWRLVCNDEEDAATEVLFVVHGAVSSRDLAPMISKVNTKKALYLRQGLTVTGYGAESFARAVEAIPKLFALFSRDIGEHNMSEMDCMAQDLSELLITKDMDPHGYLANIAGDKYVYTDDNQVRFYERKTTASGEREFVEVSPNKIQVGDIVEMHVSFTAVPLKGGRKKVVSVLRSITLLDGNLTEEAVAAKSNIRIQASTLKRKKGVHEGEMMHETGRKFSRMRIREPEPTKSLST
ncbi:hypothetical protein ARMGADRAFT_1085482 [Armillaria gallica]|uniref:Uncharacterized protein n=1 Tax=Armillaria gallica TaxID=47427 RepID=A0A2H3D7P8_ARMGA|nr:hypothetical protein ARMGADRAFT_1085482 [Armillaria gallica]